MAQIPKPSRDEVFEKLSEILADSFELDRAKITRTSTLYEELDLDSIDAIDIFTQLRELTGRRPDPADARQVRTVDELIDFVFQEIDKTNQGIPEGPTAPPADGPPSSGTPAGEQIGPPSSGTPAGEKKS